MGSSPDPPRRTTCVREPHPGRLRAADIARSGIDGSRQHLRPKVPEPCGDRAGACGAATDARRCGCDRGPGRVARDLELRERPAGDGVGAVGAGRGVGAGEAEVDGLAAAADVLPDVGDHGGDRCRRLGRAGGSDVRAQLGVVAVEVDPTQLVLVRTSSVEVSQTTKVDGFSLQLQVAPDLSQSGLPLHRSPSSTQSAA